MQLEQRFQKTEAGRGEIKSRSLAELSRSGRNLLLVIDASRSAREWLAMVQGATVADLELLLTRQMVVALAPAPAPLAAAAPAPASPLAYAELYGYLSGHARQYLGLIKGYKMALEVERCADLAALQQLAERFATEVGKEKGADVEREVRQSLGLPS